MRMMDELKHLFLYSANKKVYVPIDEKDKRKNSAILLLSPDMDTSLKMTRLPYIYNPNLFNAFYIDRNVSAYIAKMGEENINFDELEAENLSEAMINWNSKVKFKFDDRTSMMDQQYIREVFNHEAASHYAKLLKLNKIPDKINIVVHPNLTSLRKDAPKQISTVYQDDFYSYTEDNNTVHLLSKMAYDPDSMCGSYEIYLTSELVYALIHGYNKDIPYIPAKAISLSVADLEKWMDKEKRNTIAKNDIIKFMHSVNIMKSKHGYKPIHEFIKTGDINVFTKYTLKNVVNTVSKLIFESELSYFERQRLLPSDFGIPNKRKYPIHDEDHVRAAIRMFNNCDPDEEEELAESIIKRMKKFGITDVKVSAANRFRKYYKPETSKNESTTLNESYISLNKFTAYTISADTPHLEFKEYIGDTCITNGNCGEIFFDNNGNACGYYMSYTTDDDDYVWLTDVRGFGKYSNDYSMLSSLISRAVDRQNVTHAKINKDNDLYDVFTKYGFKDYGRKDNNRLLTLNYENSDNGHDKILEICSTLSDDEFKKITFFDTYKDSKFVIKRIICKSGTEPAGFLDVYHFPSNPKIAQIVIAVSDKFRGMGVAQSMVSEMLNAELHNDHDFEMYYWTAHQDNYASQNLALKNGFIDTNQVDKYGRKIFIREIPNKGDPIMNEATGMLSSGDSAIVTESMAMFFEKDDSGYSTRLRKYLYNERIKNNKEVSIMYDRVRESSPHLKKMYLKIKMYKKLNVFIDLSYYHGLFLKNNTYKLDRAVNLYFDFINRLINNPDIDSEYSKKTIFIPIDPEVWSIPMGVDMLDYKKTINPISMICRLIRTNLGALRNEWGNKDIIFVGERGYFTIDFKKFEVKDLPRLKVNIRKLTSKTEKVEDDYDIDTVPDEDDTRTDIKLINTSKSDTSKGMTMRMIDKIEVETDIKIDNVSAMNNAKSNKPHDTSVQSTHLRITNTIDIDKKSIPKDNGIVVITIDPDGPNGFKRLNNTPLSKINGTIDTYCMPK